MHHHKIFLALAVIATVAAAGPVTDYGRLIGGKASGNNPGKIVGANSNGQAVQLKGPSLHWSSGISGSEKFFNAEAVNGLVDGWKASVIRAPLGIDFAPHNVRGGYLTAPDTNWARVKRVIDAAIAKDVYAIVDWHSHTAHDPKIVRDGKTEKQLAIEFFTSPNLAGQYGNNPAVIFEIFNEPLCNTNINGTQFNVTWQDVKSYADDVIAAIRRAGFNNLIIVGTTHYSANMQAATTNPPVDSLNNYALVFHFYARAHNTTSGVWGGTGTLGNMVKNTVNAGIPVFVSEWGTYHPEDEMSIPDTAEARKWITLMDEYKLSSCVWAATAENSNTQAYFPSNGSPYVHGANNLSNWTNLDRMTMHGRFIFDWMTGGDTGTKGTGYPKYTGTKSKIELPPTSGWNTHSDADDPSNGIGLSTIGLNVTDGVAHITYTLNKNTYAHAPYVGAETEVSSMNACGYGVGYTYKGDAHFLRIQQSNVGDHHYHGNLENGSEDWVTVNVPWNYFIQEGWGVTRAVDRTLITKLEWFVKGNDGKSGTLEVKDVYCLEQAGATSVNPNHTAQSRTSARPMVSVRGRTLNITSPANSKLQIRVIDVKGRTAAKFAANAGRGGLRSTAAFSLQKIPSGRYFVDVKGAGVKQTTPIIIK